MNENNELYNNFLQNKVEPEDTKTKLIDL